MVHLSPAQSQLYTKRTVALGYSPHRPKQILVQWCLSIHSAFLDALAWLDDVMAKLKADDVLRAATVVKPLL